MGQALTACGSDAESSPLVRLLAHRGGAVWRLLDGKAGRVVRATHPTLAVTAAELSWHWLSGARAVKVDGSVGCVRRFAAAWPRAACVVAVVLASAGEARARAVLDELPPRVTRVDLCGRGVTDAAVQRL